MSYLAFLIAAGCFLVSIFKPGGDDLWLWGLLALSLGHLLPNDFSLPIHKHGPS